MTFNANFRRALPALLLTAAQLSACGTPAPEPPSRGSQPSALEAESRSGEIPGYVHTVERSRFRLGDEAVDINIGIGIRVRGSEGAILRRPNGAISAVPNADSPSLKRGPFGSCGTEHNDAVLQYFLAAGLPKSQVADVQTHALMGIEGETVKSSSEADPNGQLLAYYSVLLRTINAVPVPDSVAWARINDDGAVVYETVYWPALPSAVIHAAEQLNERIREPNGLAEFRSKLPPDLSGRPGRVQIRHTPYTAAGPFRAVAVYDIQTEIRDGTSYVRHFDSEGVELRIAPEE